jgi:hypothetical protein
MTGHVLGQAQLMGRYPGYDLRFGRPPFVSHQKWHGWNCQVDIIPHGCCPVAETKINADIRNRQK